MKHLASFFKNPEGVDELAFVPQFEMLLNYADARRQEHTTNNNKGVA